MKIDLTPALEEMVRNKVASGRYLDESEVVRDALRALERQDIGDTEKRENLLRAINEGYADVEAGRTVELHSVQDIDAYFDRT